MSAASKRLSLLLLLLSLLLLSLLPPALALSAPRRKNGKWRPVRPYAGPECGREFHDPQSKWAQSDLVVRGRWRASDESTPTRTGAYNVTLTVLKLLKQWTRNLTGQRITIGAFNHTLNCSRKDLQKAACTPCQLKQRKGHVFFLRSTPDPNYFQHAFLPIRFRERIKTKFDRLQCSQMQACLRKPRIVEPIKVQKKWRKRHQVDKLILKLICRAKDGLPRSRLTWLKNGAEVVYKKRTRAQFRTRKGTVFFRLLLRNAGPQSVGNYTCLFSNVEGSVSSSLKVQAQDLLPMTTETSVASTKAPSLNYLCTSTNSINCYNGGTCLISRLTYEPSCLCLPGYQGFVCEQFEPNLFMDALRKSLARSLASASFAALPASVSGAGAALIIFSLTIVIVLLAICCLVLRIRRRLDKAHWTAVASRKGALQTTEAHIPSDGTSNSVASRQPHLPPSAASIDAATMTDEAARPGRHHLEAPTQPTRQQPPQPPPHQRAYFYPSLQHPQAAAGEPDSDAAWQQQPLLPNGPQHPGVAPYTYQSPGHSTLPPVRIRPVFDYGGAGEVTTAPAAAEAPAAAVANSSAAANPAASDEPIDLLKEFNRIEWLQQQQQQQQQQQPTESADTETGSTTTGSDTLLPRRRGGQQKQKSSQAAQHRQLLPFPGHGPPPS